MGLIRAGPVGSSKLPDQSAGEREERIEPLTDGGYDRAFSVDSPVQTHQNLDSQLSFGAILTRVANEILYGILQYLERVPRFRRDAAAARRLLKSNRMSYWKLRGIWTDKVNFQLMIQELSLNPHESCL
jgi:hypothetical protein